MPLVRRDFLRFSGAALAAPLPSRAGAAQAYPSRPVGILVGFPAGGPMDLAARVISPWLTVRLGQPFHVENRPGESGNLATRAVVQAAPDGYTLLLCGPVNTINTTLFTSLDFDFTHDVTPVASISRVPLVLEVHPSVGARSVPEFLALAKAGGIRVAYAGVGTPQHVAIELFKMKTGADLTLVPYPGSTAALADLLEGRVEAMFDPAPSSISHIRAGRLIPLAVTTSEPYEPLRDVPPVSRFVPGYEAGSWFGLVAPNGTPDAIVARLNEEVRAGLADRNLRDELAQMGAIPVSSSASEFARFVVAETVRYSQVIKALRLRAQ
jgi:tripartite-type tricarboxylate transporter receptor subunit TctC